MIDMVGQKFGRLTVIEFSHRKGKNYYWKCICDCGNPEIRIVQVQGLKRGTTQSCGCLNKEIITKHGLDGDKIYHVFNAMKNRCYSKDNNSYHNYGARGINICDEWLNDVVAFVNWAYNSGYKEGLTIERKDVNGNYEPNNCTWVSRKAQMNNTRYNINIEYKGETKTLTEWSETIGMKMNTLYYRIAIAKWDIEKAFNTPLRGVN